jgi:hypothetical protein
VALRHVTAASIQSIQITTPKLLDFEERVVHAEERSHHDAILQKSTTTFGSRLKLGEAPIRSASVRLSGKRFNSRPRTVFDPPRREFLRKYFNVPVENVGNFRMARVFYLNVLGFPPEPVHIENWPAEIPQPKAA